MKRLVVADFIVQHSIDKQLDLNVGYIVFTLWNCILIYWFAKVIAILVLFLYHQTMLLLILLTDWYTSIGSDDEVALEASLLLLA
jgi:hypothetical protein